MGNFCSYRVEDGISIIHFTRSPGRLEFIEAINELAANYPYQYRLWDLQDVVLELDQDDLRAIVTFAGETLTRTKEPLPIRTGGELAQACRSQASPQRYNREAITRNTRKEQRD